MAIRPVATSKQNLAVVGGQPNAGAAIYTAPWGDGNNDPALWHIDLATESPWFYIQSKLNSNIVLSTDPNNQQGDLVINTYEPSQSAQLWQCIPTTNGYALLNGCSGLAASYTRDKGDVVQVNFSQLNSNSTWTLSNENADAFTAIRPVSNSGENLNVYQSNVTPLSKVCTWSWGNGNHDNALWLFVPAAPPA